MAVNYQDIGKRIKQVRLNRNLTQEKLAEMINISITRATLKTEMRS